MPPPPCEPSVMPKPSMLDGLQEKLLGNGLVALLLLVWQFGLASPSGKIPEADGSVPVRSVVPVGNPARSVGSNGSDGKFTPFESTVIPAPSSAPIKDGSCSCSARLPLSSALHPTVASSGKRSTCGLLAEEPANAPLSSNAVKYFHPVPGQLNVPVGS